MRKTVGVSLTEEQNQQVRAAAEELVRRHDGNVSAASRSISVSQSWLSQFIDGGKGCSLNTAAVIAAALDKEVKELLGTDPGENLNVVPWSELPGYDKALRDARALTGTQFSERVWRLVGASTTAPAPRIIQPAHLVKAAELFHMLGGAKSLTAGSDTVPASVRGGRKSSKMRKPR